MKLNIAVFSSDAGINTRDLIAFQDLFKDEDSCPFEVVYFFSDNLRYKNTHDYYIAQNKYMTKLNPLLKEFDVRKELQKRNIQYSSLDINDFYANFGFSSKIDRRMSMHERIRIRKLYNRQVEGILQSFEEDSGIKIDLIVLDTYLSIIAEPLLDRCIVNCHWGDLSRVDKEGKRIYKGYHGVLKSLSNEDKKVYGTAHFVNSKVDDGEIICLSRPIIVDFMRDAEFLEFDFPVIPEEAIKFLKNPLNYRKNLEVEALYEAYLRLYIDSELLLDCLKTLAENFSSSIKSIELETSTRVVMQF